MEQGIMSDKLFSPSKEFSRKARISQMERYWEIYNRSIKNPEAFWGEIAKRINWVKKWDKVREYDFVEAKIKWFEGGTLNASFNCLDRHVEAGFGDQIALIWEGNDPSKSTTFTYAQLLEIVQKFSNFTFMGIGHGLGILLIG